MQKEKWREMIRRQYKKEFAKKFSKIRLLEFFLTCIILYSFYFFFRMVAGLKRKWIAKSAGINCIYFDMNIFLFYRIFNFFSLLNVCMFLCQKIIFKFCPQSESVQFAMKAFFFSSFGFGGLVSRSIKMLILRFI